MADIVVVEDQENLFTVLEMLLNPWCRGGRLRHFGNGKDGLDYLRGHQPDLLVTDLSMPVIDGWAMLEALHREHKLKKVPVLVTTGESLSGERLEALRGWGVRRVLKKPYQGPEVIAAVGGILGRPVEDW